MKDAETVLSDNFKSRLCYSLVADKMQQVEKVLLKVKTIQFLNDYSWTYGKRLRPLIFLLSNLSIRTAHSKPLDNSEREARLASAIELLHEASLIHDDIVDKSELRRGKPTMQMTHGEGLSLLIGDYMIFQSLKLILDSAETRQDILLARELADAGIHIAEGEAEQLYRYIEERNTNKRVSLENYLGIIAKKTAAFFAGCAEAGAAMGGAGKEIRQIFLDFGMNLGLLFQMMDDLMDVYGSEASAQKSLKNNLKEGTITLPIIHAWRLFPKNKSLIKLVAQKKLDSKSQAEVYKLLSHSKVITACKKTIKEYYTKTEQQLSLMPKNIYSLGLADIFNYIHEFSWAGIKWKQ